MPGRVALLFPISPTAEAGRFCLFWMMPRPLPTPPSKSSLVHSACDGLLWRAGNSCPTTPDLSLFPLLPWLLFSAPVSSSAKASTSGGGTGRGRADSQKAGWLRDEIRGWRLTRLAHDRSDHVEGTNHPKGTEIAYYTVPTPAMVGSRILIK